MPNLPASKTTSGEFSISRMPRGTDGHVLTGTGAGTDPAYEASPAPTCVWIGRTSKATGTTDSWVDVDCSGQIPAGAIAALGVMHVTKAAEFGGVRANGAGDEGTYEGYGGVGGYFFVVPLDANRVFEQKISDIAVDCYIVGYFK